MDTKKEVFREHLGKYLKASREEKTKILDYLETAIRMHRKAVIRALRREQMRDRMRPKRKPGPPVIYTADVTAALKEVWEISGELCAERLYAVIYDYVMILERDRMWQHGNEATQKLLTMSLGTMKDRVARFIRIKAGGGRSTTKPSDLKELIPIRTGPWENPEPGFGEVDTVVHCGPALAGNMAYTVNFTDIATGWGESAAQINKGQIRTRESVESIEKRLPFPLKGLDPDTGSEFINWHLKGWCDTHKPRVELSRSRPNHRNDNAHIEQKNYTGVRKFLGYSRIDTEEAVTVMNELYAGPLRLYRNFFQPSMKCIEKIRIGSRYIRKYDDPQTPYERVLADERVAQNIKDELLRIYATLNPKVLRDETDSLINKIFKIQRLRKHQQSR